MSHHPQAAMRLLHQLYLQGALLLPVHTILGRENLEISFNTAQNEISKLITESDIDEARNLESWTANRSPAEIFVLMGNVQRFINSMESLNNMDWTAGQHVSNDGRMEAVKESCEIFKKSTSGMSQ